MAKLPNGRSALVLVAAGLGPMSNTHIALRRVDAEFTDVVVEVSHWPLSERIGLGRAGGLRSLKRGEIPTLPS